MAVPAIVAAVQAAAQYVVQIVQKAIELSSTVSRSNGPETVVIMRTPQR
jgi:hypothetical protein